MSKAAAPTKRPSFQFYPGDWLEELGLRASGYAARGLWMDMLCFMHQGEPFGHLRKKGRDIGPAELARMTGGTTAVVKRLLAELEGHDVFSRTPEGTIYCRRQVRDEALRAARAAGGPKGGEAAFNNPNASRPGDARGGGRPPAAIDKDEPPPADQEGGSQGGSEGGSAGTPPSSPSPSPSPPPDNERSSTPDPEGADGTAGGRDEKQAGAYADVVWDEFLRLSGQPSTRVMNPGEFDQVKRWMEQGVPLRIVLRGMADTKGQGSRLQYYGPSVEEALGNWRRALGPGVWGPS